MSHKDYDAMVAEQLGDRFTFTLGGKDFTCRRKLHWTKQSRVFLGLASAEGSAMTTATLNFIRACLLPADREKFEALIAEPEGDDYPDDEVIVTKRQLDAVVNDLFDHYAGKAETSVDDSSDSPAPAGPQSNVVSLNSQEA